MKTCKNCIYSRKIMPRNTNCPSEFVCSLSDEDFHNCISDDMSHFLSKVIDQPLEDDAKQASIPYSYVENDVNMREAYEAGYEKAKKEYERPKGEWVSHIQYCKQHNLIPTGYELFVWCNRCNCPNEKKTNFCPNCGASMLR